MATRRHLRVADDDGPVAVDTFAARLTDKALHCRELGHTWRPLVASWDASARAFDRRLRCSSCRTERIQILSAHGAVVSNHYRYPDGYLATNVDGGVAGRRDVFRLEAVLRTLDDGDVKAIRKAVANG